MSLIERFHCIDNKLLFCEVQFQCGLQLLYKVNCILQCYVRFSLCMCYNAPNSVWSYITQCTCIHNMYVLLPPIVIWILYNTELLCMLFHSTVCMNSMCVYYMYYGTPPIDSRTCLVSTLVSMYIRTPDGTYIHFTQSLAHAHTYTMSNSTDSKYVPLVRSTDFVSSS